MEARLKIQDRFTVTQSQMARLKERNSCVMR